MAADDLSIPMYEGVIVEAEKMLHAWTLSIGALVSD